MPLNCISDWLQIDFAVPKISAMRHSACAHGTPNIKQSAWYQPAVTTLSRGGTVLWRRSLLWCINLVKQMRCHVHNVPSVRILNIHN